MSDDMQFRVAATMQAPLAGIVLVEPDLVTDCAKCEVNVNLGLFFDGTHNNIEADSNVLADSNIARLFNAYLEKNERGYYRRYIPGVGTRFPEIREETESSLGDGFAIGCEERVLFGLLWVLNAVHRHAYNNQALFDDAQIKALCCCQPKSSSIMRAVDYAALGRLGLQDGLRMPDILGDGLRESILKDQVGKLQKKLVKGRPVIKECFIDVFGFSRGAAEARVFCSWLNALLVDGKLAGMIVHFRFVGLMDTVASAGFWSSVVASTTGLNGGHSGWADSHHLRIPPSVKNCVHMVAMHELRKNFPLDTITVDGGLPPHCQEFAYPGTHSDVGGGYKPGELGISVGQDGHEGDALKLAQIPLNHMLECALAAGAPMSLDRAATQRNPKPFAIDPRVQKAYEDFLTVSTVNPRAVREWLQPYLNWRWQLRAHYASLNHVKRASKADAALLVQYNAYLMADAQLLHTSATRRRWDRFFPLQTAMNLAQSISTAALDNEARTVFNIAKSAATTAPALHDLFDYFVHDSLAGFNHHAVELTGYWRYRKGFLGNPKRLIAENDDMSGMDNVAASG